MIELMFRALVGGLGVAAIAGPLGAFVVWRRMAYFGDTLAHSALLGIALGFLFDVNLNLAIIVLCVGLAAALVTLQKKHIIATDTLLGILAHSSLSLGMVAVSFLDDVRIDLMSYLFGDLLAVSQNDLYWIYGGGIAVLLLLAVFWKPLLAMTVNEELAKVEGYPVETTRLLLMLLVALVIAIAMKIVGVLLITSLMIIPAATARKLSQTPVQMASMASLIGCLSVCGGLWASYQWDTPTGPSVVVCAATLFLVAYSIPTRSKKVI
ncbi:zinc ABC transporter permease subunit ZnuB [Marinomonas mediterranea]|jgi:ABC-type Mn2+/Zn2+ transport systems, permease components|uniref:High-affinity zinc uptake system membrane protein ZnuB n=1 Tax=Marinomonas mediterranea (strain ATCC 700492 / JCM 21426 / NBRC 103028 / MMB-1) TaxID=717774 RepID=F2JWA7_MARM1|nr:zinc ABC transporter permease subunit ZnuB [Marinomonas mediterranea]ADZ89495.1 ABC-type transporter, integral membrane subunit [Marinomonas mediterranea MMB-1]WCN07594.1 zinc ABC transporter permease subunit ZnuB [Marinomonas mediterranea]WCN11693.1 zinc ABC transporter permease subunit ZnuB [Marinomonas mediterranea]WCN15744.1 zinc ABC transporter permease subunit ZnuB [Marinomonas mediterranea MMB-1]